MRYHWAKELLQSWLKDHSLQEEPLYRSSGRLVDWAGMAASPLYADMIGEIREEAERLLDLPEPELTEELYERFEKTGNRLAYEGKYFERRRRLASFALMSLLDADKPAYMQALIGTIEAVLEEPTWCLPAHMRGQQIDRNIDLFSAETGFALSEIIVLLGSRLPERLRESMLGHIDRRLFVPYLSYGPYGWETAEHNWAAVCAGSIGAAALLVEQSAARKAAILVKTVETMNHYLAGFGEDGACLEGPGYWNYGFGYFVYFADLLNRATDGNADLFALDKVKAVSLFQQRCYLAGDRPANFSDALPHVSVHIGLSDYLADRFGEVEHPPLKLRAAYTDDHCARFAPALRNVLWFRPEARREANWKPGSWYLPDAQWFISRSVSSAGSFGFAAKGGSNDEPHNHIDVGHFILLSGDDPAVAADLGSGEYTADYFGEGRYTYDCNGAQGHSLPIVSGHPQQVGGASKARMPEAVTGERQDHFSLELADCYPSESGLQSLKRSFVLLKDEKSTLTVNDNFLFGESGGQVTEVIVTRCQPSLAEDGRIVLAGGQHMVELTYEAGLFRPAIVERPFVNHFGHEETYYRIHLIAEHSAKRSQQFALHFEFK
ncbi:heparinase II/III family protein [Paenibacillus sp. PR3]|uniref:Heparinase II/III family protein n=1 Tax=Paenibacillus terricola TaxID=2763503 RepID=A0ABR8MVH8_9BACL|nr:heparinase II/III family protein [Paenibacillus terricola]MBD3919974.1 heparinase II/III family protein [Paenibacillus terricola]